MGVERVDYYSDEEYQQALMMEESMHAQWQAEWEAEGREIQHMQMIMYEKMLIPGYESLLQWSDEDLEVLITGPEEEEIELPF